MMRSRRNTTECEEESKIGEPRKDAQDVQDIGLVMFNIPGRLKVVKNEELGLRMIFKCCGNVS
jgi:hypothetical protein